MRCCRCRDIQPIALAFAKNANRCNNSLYVSQSVSCTSSFYKHQLILRGLGGTFSVIAWSAGNLSVWLLSYERTWMEGVSALHTMSHFCVFVYVCGTLWCTNGLQTFNTVLIYAECTVLQFSNSKLHGDNVSGALIKYRYNHNLAILKFLDANRF